MIDDNEVFYPLKGFEGLYEINKNGVIKTLPFEIICSNGSKRIAKIKIKNIFIYKSGYAYTGLSKNKKDKSYTIHRLVAETFIPNPENKPYVNHINGIKNDNRAENLEWVSASENELHKYNVLGRLNARRKLSEEAVYDIWHNIELNINIKDKRKKYLNVNEMAEKYGVQKQLILSILSGQFYGYTTSKFKPHSDRIK